MGITDRRRSFRVRVAALIAGEFRSSAGGGSGLVSSPALGPRHLFAKARGTHA